MAERFRKPYKAPAEFAELNVAIPRNEQDLPVKVFPIPSDMSSIGRTIGAHEAYRHFLDAIGLQ